MLCLRSSSPVPPMLLEDSESMAPVTGLRRYSVDGTGRAKSTASSAATNSASESFPSCAKRGSKKMTEDRDPARKQN